MSIRLVDTHQDLDVKECPVCGVTYAVPAALMQNRRQHGGSWYCPNGHSLVFTETEVDRLRKQTKQLDARLTSTRDQLRASRDDCERIGRSNNALRGVVTRERNRVARGVCPCCNRTFANVARHMESQHPDFASSAPEAG